MDYVDIPQALALRLFTAPPEARLGPWDFPGGECIRGPQRAQEFCQLECYTAAVHKLDLHLPHNE